MILLPTRHPSEDQLLDYVSGRSDAAARALMDAHLALCDRCAKIHAALAQSGGEALSAGRGLPLPSDLLNRILARLPEGTPDPDEVPLPAPLRSLLPPTSARKWEGALARGARFLRVMQSEGAELFLVHLQPGAAFPHHAHAGRECAVMLQGGAEMDGQRFEAGDWAEFPAGTHHAPRALADEACWVLARVEGVVRMSGWRGWLQRLSGS